MTEEFEASAQAAARPREGLDPADLRGPAEAQPAPLRRRLFSVDHKTVGTQFLVTGGLLAFFGALLGLVLRSQIAWPGARVPFVGQTLFPGTGGSVPPDVYGALFTMHGTLMTFFVVLPLFAGALGSLLIPPMIGSDKMAFPRLNALSYWLLWPGIFCVFVAFGAPGEGAGAGWFVYGPLRALGAYPADRLSGQTWWLAGIAWAVLSALLGALVTFVTLLRRPASDHRPLTLWGFRLGAVLQLVALPVLVLAAFLIGGDRAVQDRTIEPSEWWAHLSILGYPLACVVLLPAMGLVSDILLTHARRPVALREPSSHGLPRIMALAMLTTVLFGMGLWGQRVFSATMGTHVELGVPFPMIWISLPVGVLVLGWLVTVWRGRVRLTSAMQCAIAFATLMAVGLGWGIWIELQSESSGLQQTTSVVATFHLVVAGGAFLALFGALYHWFPRIFGRHLSEWLGSLHVFGTFVLLCCVCLPMHELGMAGMARRSVDPYVTPALEVLQPLSSFVTWCTLTLLAWQLLFVANVVYGLVAGMPALRNPWSAAGLEWESGGDVHPGAPPAPASQPLETESGA